MTNLRESSINFTNNSVITNSQVESNNNLSQNETVMQTISIPEKINEINGKYIFKIYNYFCLLFLLANRIKEVAGT